MSVASESPIVYIPVYDTPEIQQNRYKMMLKNGLIKEFKMEDDSVVVGHYSVLNCVKKGETVLEEVNGISRRRFVLNITPHFIVLNDGRKIRKTKKNSGNNRSCYIEDFY